MAVTEIRQEKITVSIPLTVSSQSSGVDMAYKAKLVQLASGLLVIVYGDAVEDNPAHNVYDLRAAAERPARDIFVRGCNAQLSDCSVGDNWSAAINVSSTAVLSSIDSDWKANAVRTPYHGDSGNPHAFASGNHIVISWVDTYCPGGQQRTTTYSDHGNREIPMSCVYAAHASGSVASIDDWTIDRLSDGGRDAKQDVNQGQGTGAWVIAWQEDPLGLQPGEAEGPGEGASGARVSKGTDIWYSYTDSIAAATGALGVWATPVRITDNATGSGPTGQHYTIRDSAGSVVPGDEIDSGIAGASRVNARIVGGSSPPATLVAYEETKGSAGLDSGKFLRYQNFPYNQPPADPAGRVGCIISDPAENARRARIVAQTRAGPGSGLRWLVMWRQGVFTQGGPADVVVRMGFSDFATDHVSPAIDPGCATSSYDQAIQLNNSPALNISSNTPSATSGNLADSSGNNSLENARAHRAVLRGDDAYFGYIYTPDWAVAENTDLENYQYYLRHYAGASDAWSRPENISNLDSTSINVIEPRLIAAPSSGPGCSDPDNITSPADCQNIDALVAAWGTQDNVYAHLGGARHLDIFFRRTLDRGRTFSPVFTLAAGSAAQGEAQLRITPDASTLFAVWNETADNGDTDSNYLQAVFSALPARVTSSDSGAIPGCSYNPGAGFDPVFPLLILAALSALALSGRKADRL